jgi:cytochrome c biogenesis protein CcmG, thiol:disulfide interchange protein DsbE
MNQRSLIIVTVVIVLIIAAGAGGWYYLHPSKQLQTASQSPVIGKATLGGTAPQFEVATTSGLFDLSKTDKPVFLEIFATWCPHCQRETAVIDRLFAKYQSRMDFVGVSGSDTAMDGTSAASQNDLLAWIKKFDVKYPVAYDPLTAVADLYLQGGFPTIAVIDKEKTIVYLNSGEIGYDELVGAIEKALKD